MTLNMNNMIERRMSIDVYDYSKPTKCKRPISFDSNINSTYHPVPEPKVFIDNNNTV